MSRGKLSVLLAAMLSFSAAYDAHASFATNRTEAPPTGKVEKVYYYRGHVYPYHYRGHIYYYPYYYRGHFYPYPYGGYRYPYRYHGYYFGHRYYRLGRWHYY